MYNNYQDSTGVIHDTIGQQYIKWRVTATLIGVTLPMIPMLTQLIQQFLYVSRLRPTLATFIR